MILHNYLECGQLLPVFVWVQKCPRSITDYIFAMINMDMQKAISIIQMPHLVAKAPCHMLNFKVGSGALRVVLMELGGIDGQGWPLKCLLVLLFN